LSHCRIHWLTVTRCSTFAFVGRTSLVWVGSHRCASARSCAFCKLSQNSGVVPSARASRIAVSAVIDLLPATICVIRFTGTPSVFARCVAVAPRGFRYSSRSTSPGCTALFTPYSIRHTSTVVNRPASTRHRTPRSRAPRTKRNPGNLSIAGVGTLPRQLGAPFRLHGRAAGLVQNVSRKLVESSDLISLDSWSPVT
jgi:hypothetical protein